MTQRIERLAPLRRYYGTQIFALGFFTLAVAAGVVFAAHLKFSWVISISFGATVAIIIGVLWAVKLSAIVLSSTEFLAQAILVSSGKADMDAPDIKLLRKSQDFFKELAAHVYDMASNVMPVPEAPTVTSSGDEVSGFQKSLLHNAPIAIYVLDAAANLTYANQLGAEYAGLSSTESLGRPLYDVLKLSFASDQTLEDWLHESNEKVLTGTHSWDRVRLTLPDGSIRQCDMAVRFNKNNPDGVEVVITLFDHTDKYSRDDHGANFVSMAVHELRTPLTIMRGYIEVFEDEVAGKLDPEQASFMRNMSAQAQQLSSFVNNIQNFARIEENQLALTLKEESWTTVVTETVAEMQLRARVRNKTITLEVADNLPTVAVERKTINEVLVNLLENSIKYTHSDAPIAVKSYLKDENWIETTVTDKGIGIPESLMGHIFDKFYRSHRSNSSVGGTGLGLYLSKAIVTAHGGEIWAQSREGEGSTFGFTVPTFASVADQVESADNKAISRGAHGWIKNHSLYRG